MQQKLYRINELTKVLSLSKSTIWRLTKTDPLFPQPIKISGKMTVFKGSAVDEWINSIGEDDSE